MELDTALELSRTAFFVTLTTAAPILVSGLVVGFIISIAQAVTQLQEQTLTFVPKIAAMVVAGAVFIPWIAAAMIEYARQTFSELPW